MSELNDKKIWGTYTWYFFHALSFSIKNEHFDKEKIFLVECIENICDILPCPNCRAHALHYLRNYDIRKATNKELFKNYLFNFHNKVNKNTGKKIFTYNEFDSLYKRCNLGSICNKFFAIYNTKAQTSYSLLMSINKKQTIKSIKEHLILHKNKYMWSARG